MKMSKRDFEKTMSIFFLLCYKTLTEFILFEKFEMWGKKCHIPDIQYIQNHFVFLLPPKAVSIKC